MKSHIKNSILGLAIGDALGVPVEFQPREQLDRNPVKAMREFGTHHQPKGTWSDDSSLTFCLMESLCNGYDLQDMSHKFQAWRYENYWTPHGTIFDIGITTSHAIGRMRKGISPELCGGMDEDENGNGSLMRILPLVFFIKDLPIEERYEKIKEVSSLTHGHFRSIFACFIYSEFIISFLELKNARNSYKQMQSVVLDFAQSNRFNPMEISLFNRILKATIWDLPISEIRGSGYVLHSLEASFWCLLNAGNFSEAVLDAVNLGEDTDTTGAITGSLAALVFGYESIPQNWIEVLVRKNDILELVEKFSASCES